MKIMTIFLGGSKLAKLENAQNIINQTYIYNRNNKLIELPKAGYETQRRYFPNTEDVRIFSENPQMTKNVHQGLALFRKNGFVPDQQDIFISKKTDSLLQNADIEGTYKKIDTPAGKRDTIIMRKEMPSEMPEDTKRIMDLHVQKDWLAGLAAQEYPVWGKTTYSGMDSHSFAHEEGHLFHEKEINKKVNAQLAPEEEWLTQQFGSKFATAPYDEKMLMLSERFKTQLASLKQNSFRNLTPEIQSDMEKMKRLIVRIQDLSSAKLTAEEVQILTQEMSHNGYFASNAKEAVAEMFARLVGGKTLSENLSKIYKKYHGPTSALLRI